LTNEMTLGSLFDGVAMFPLAAQRNGIKAVWASEIEKFPIAVSKHHFPDMKHLGDICKINGAKIEPVDIITFSSPCQDLSVAGKRAGLTGERSGLFSEAIRIIREMRVVTNGEYPKYCIWENVFGVFSSNKGQDFLQVLQELAETEIPVPRSDKNGKITWANAGVVRAVDREISWRTTDAQYWGVPQRRKRVFLVASFGKQCAGEILLIEQGGDWDSETSGEARKETAGSIGDGVETAGKFIAFNGRQDPVYGQVTGAIDADRATQCVLHPKVAGTICASGAGTNRPAGQGNETDLVFVIQSATMSGDKKQNGLGVSDGPCYTLDCRADHAVCYPEPANALLAKGNLSYRADVDNLVIRAVDVRNLCETEELSGTLQSKQTGGYSLNYQNPVRIGYAIRRLLPIECERLMGFPDNWTNIPGASDTARYKAIGNSLVCNIAEWIFSQIVKVEKGDRQ